MTENTIRADRGRQALHHYAVVIMGEGPEDEDTHAAELLADLHHRLGPSRLHTALQKARAAYEAETHALGALGASEADE